MTWTISPKAQSDLNTIWDYTEDRWGQDQAERYIGKLRSGIEVVAADHRRGETCDGIRGGYLKYVVGSHVLFFVLTASGIDIKRILHSSMDFQRHL